MYIHTHKIQAIQSVLVKQLAHSKLVEGVCTHTHIQRCIYMYIYACIIKDEQTNRKQLTKPGPHTGERLNVSEDVEK